MSTRGNIRLIARTPLPKQTVQNLILGYFDWVFGMCQSIHLGDACKERIDDYITHAVV